MLDRANSTAWVNRRLLSPAFALITAASLLAAQEASAQQRALVPPQSSIINSALSKSWSNNKLTPAKRATDDEFMRRLFLDVIGRIPTPEEIRDFERDQSSNKRAALIERILMKDSYAIKSNDGKTTTFEYTREYAQHWADVWTVWTMTRGGTHETYHNQMRFWLEGAFGKDMPYDERVRKLLTATGTGNQNGATNFIMAHLGEKNTDRQVSDGPFDAIPITSRVTRLFLGVQTQCTQCHDHPFNPEWGQENFWGVNAFFRSTLRETDDKTDTPSAPAGTNKKNKGMEAVKVTLKDDPRLNSGMRIYYERRSGVLMSIKPTFLPNLADLEKEKGERAKKPMPANSSKSRREILADYVISHDNFGKAYVNRMWAHFFGRGLNEQAVADDFGGHNKLIHPEMLEELGQEFIKYQYNPKDVIRWICNSDAYNLSYIAPTKDMAKSDYDAFFAHMPLKAMSPEVLFNALETAVKADMAKDKEARKLARDNWMKKLVSNFGDDEGNEMTFNGTIVQALLMMNGKEMNDEIKRPDGVVARAIARGNPIDEIYLTALGRHPSSTPINIEKVDPKTKRKTIYSQNEMAVVQAQLAVAMSAPAGKGKSGPREAFFEDLFWALLNTNEFMLNH